MGKNLAGRLNRLLSVAAQAAGRLDSEAVAAAEARLAPVIARRLAHFRACIRAKHEGRPEPEYVHEPYEGEEEDRELVSRDHAQLEEPDRLREKLDLIRERRRAAQDGGLREKLDRISERKQGENHEGEV